MVTKKFGLAVALAMSVMVMVGCGNKGVSTAPQTTASAPAYSTVQTVPATAPQQRAANRGVKLEKEECEEKALDISAAPREFGIGLADDEAFAINLALLDARAKLSQQLEVMVTGAIRNYNNKYRQGDQASSVNKASMLNEAYFEQFLTNTRPFCKNTYVKENGDYNVYVAIEMSETMVNNMFDKMSADTELDIDFKEHQFKEEMKDMRARYLEGKQ